MFVLRKQLSIHNFTYIPSSLDFEGVPLEYGLFCSSSTLLCSEDVKSLSSVTSSCRIFKITITDFLKRLLKDVIMISAKPKVK